MPWDRFDVFQNDIEHLGNVQNPRVHCELLQLREQPLEPELYENIALGQGEVPLNVDFPALHRLQKVLGEPGAGSQVQLAHFQCSGVIERVGVIGKIQNLHGDLLKHKRQLRSTVLIGREVEVVERSGELPDEQVDDVHLGNSFQMELLDPTEVQDCSGEAFHDGQVEGLRTVRLSDHPALLHLTHLDINASKADDFDGGIRVPGGKVRGNDHQKFFIQLDHVLVITIKLPAECVDFATEALDHGLGLRGDIGEAKKVVYSKVVQNLDLGEVWKVHDVESSSRRHRECGG